MNLKVFDAKYAALGQINREIAVLERAILFYSAQLKELEQHKTRLEGGN
jgi:hypothetical protein